MSADFYCQTSPITIEIRRAVGKGVVETKGMSELGGQGGARPSPQILADQLGTIHKRHKKSQKGDVH